MRTGDNWRKACPIPGEASMWEKEGLDRRLGLELHGQINMWLYKAIQSRTMMMIPDVHHYIYL